MIECDFLIVGTSVTESILAAACSWQGKSVLQIDANSYYGGYQAALGWQSLIDLTGEKSLFLDKLECKIVDENGLQGSGKYFLELSPKVCYASSEFVRLLVSSGVSNYMDFKALQKVWVVQNTGQGLTKVPDSRSEIFTSQDYDLVSKRKLMKFLKFAMEHDADENEPIWVDRKSDTIMEFLCAKPFLLSADYAKIIIYAIGLGWSTNLTVQEALPQIKLHLASFGVYGPFPILVPMHGGGSEISQAFCRASAIKGAVQVLNQTIEKVNRQQDGFVVSFTNKDIGLESAKCQYIIQGVEQDTEPYEYCCRRTVIVAGDCKMLTGDEYDSAIIVLQPHALENTDSPVHIILRGHGTGECPVGQWIWYLSTIGQEQNANKVFDESIDILCRNIDTLAGISSSIQLLFTASYSQPVTSSHVKLKEPRIVNIHHQPTTLDYSIHEIQAKSAYDLIFNGDWPFI